MERDDRTARERILDAAMEFIAGGKTGEEITMRQIAARAGVNLALVNYYFRSKENLLSQVVGNIMGGLIAQATRRNAGADAQTRLRDMLLATADAAFQYRNIASIALSAELKAGCRHSVELVTPLLREMLPGVDEEDIGILALQLMMPFHHIVIDPALYGDRLRTDFFDVCERRRTINRMVDCLLAGRAGRSL